MKMNRYTIVTRIMLIMATILMVDMFAIQVMAQGNNGTTTANLNVDGNNSSVTSISTSVTNPITPSTINADVTVSTPANPGAGNETTPPAPVQTTTPEPSGTMSALVNGHSTLMNVLFLTINWLVFYKLSH